MDWYRRPDEFGIGTEHGDTAGCRKTSDSCSGIDAIRDVMEPSDQGDAFVAIAMADKLKSSGGGLEDFQWRLDEVSQLVVLHGYQLKEIFRLLRTQTTTLSPTSAASVT
ncbi:hypothetical protein Sjap_026107 [Stephania japonica]|uniref:Uncharacterized protein n=1 Tax=Stephania japonica TaxID=461633 RepID=A0AAP0HIK6_9MAGN